MNLLPYFNGAIYEYIYEDNDAQMIVLFSSFSFDNKSILGFPISTTEKKEVIPLLIEGNIKYLNYCNLKCINVNNITNFIGILDENVINTLTNKFTNLFKNKYIVASIPSETNEVEDSKALNIQSEIKSFPSKKREKYTIEDYKYILKNYDANPEDILKKYNIRDKKTLYKLKYSLINRFGKIVDKSENKLTNRGEQKE